MTGIFVVSLDFELMWGVRDHRTVAEYGDAVLGARQAIPKILERFCRNRIRATWATVGFLFASNRDHLLEHAPPVESRPHYEKSQLSPYNFVANGLGRDERDDPWHFGRCLVERIADTDGQELATHTFSHFYCLEPGATPREFSADLSSAISIAHSAGQKLTSLVFPRNQMTSAYIDAAVEKGLRIYRSNPANFLYRPRPASQNTAVIRALRFADGALPIVSGLSFSQPTRANGAIAVPASRFFRPKTCSQVYDELHMRRVEGEMLHAARNNLSYHLWWHPHNTGTNVEANLARLDELLAFYRRLEEEYGMRSCSMGDFADAQGTINANLY